MREVEAVAAACGLGGFRYLAFPPVEFPAEDVATPQDPIIPPAAPQLHLAEASLPDPVRSSAPPPTPPPPEVSPRPGQPAYRLLVEAAGTLAAPSPTPRRGRKPPRPAARIALAAAARKE